MINCAVTGAIHTPTISDALPYTADEIAFQAVAAAEAGAPLLHLHARNPEDGSVSLDREHFAAFLPRIKQSSNAVVNISTGGSLKDPIEDRIAPARRFSPTMCSLNMGSMNFSFLPLAKRYDTWHFDWEKDYVESSDTYIFRNTFRDIRTVAETLRPLGVKFEPECYDVGHLHNRKFCMDSGLFRSPVSIQFIFGILGGIGSDADNLIFIERTADRLFGSDYRWSVLGVGAAQITLATTASQMGGNVRVGLVDSLPISRGQLAEFNAQQIARIRRIVEELGSEVAESDEAREVFAQGRRQGRFLKCIGRSSRSGAHAALVSEPTGRDLPRTVPPHGFAGRGFRSEFGTRLDCCRGQRSDCRIELDPAGPPWAGPVWKNLSQRN